MSAVTERNVVAGLILVVEIEPVAAITVAEARKAREIDDRQPRLALGERTVVVVDHAKSGHTQRIQVEVSVRARV